MRGPIALLVPKPVHVDEYHRKPRELKGIHTVKRDHVALLASLGGCLANLTYCILEVCQESLLDTDCQTLEEQSQSLRAHVGESLDVPCTQYAMQRDSATHSGASLSCSSRLRWQGCLSGQDAW